MPWTWVALPSVAALAVGFTVGSFIYFSRADRAQNRWLGRFIVLEALYLDGGFLAQLLAPDEATLRGLLAANICVASLAFACYLPFLATLTTPLVRPLRGRGLRILLPAYVLATILPYFLARDLYFTIDGRRDGVWITTLGPLDVVFNNVIAGIGFLFGFFVAFSAWRRATRASAARLRARAYVLAFGFRDLSFVVTITVFTFVFVSSPAPALIWAALVVPAVQLVYLPLLVYGIAKTQLFAIDLKIKWTLRRGTVVGIVVAAFLVVSQLIQNYTSERFGWLGGALAAGLVLFAIQPLQRGVDRMADRLMPNVHPSPEYEAYRKLIVYRAAVESAHEVGGVSGKERRLLDSLRGKLGVRAEDALSIEREFTA